MQKRVVDVSHQLNKQERETEQKGSKKADGPPFSRPLSCLALKEAYVLLQDKQATPSTMGEARDTGQKR
jgi:hypothetical protein